MDKRIVFISLLVIGLIGCSSSKAIIKNSSSSNTIIQNARSYIGTPYKYAGTTQSGMDCSGLTSVVFDRSAIDLARSADGQSKQGRLVKLNDARSGDLIFFKKGGKVFHVGIISKVGKGQLWMIHSSSSKGVVEQEVLSNTYWRPKLHIIRRLS